jgi:hypothetical protein
MRTLTNKNAKATTGNVPSPIRFAAYPVTKQGHFSIKKEVEGERTTTQDKALTITVTHAAYSVEGRMNEREIFGDWTTDLDTPIKLFRKVSTDADAKSKPMFADEKGKAKPVVYGDVKPALQEAKARLILNLLGVGDEGQPVKLILGGMNLSQFYAFSKRVKLDLSETPTLTFSYVGGLKKANPKNESEVFFFPNIGAETLTAERSEMIEDEIVSEISDYIAYKCYDPSEDEQAATENATEEPADGLSYFATSRRVILAATENATEEPAEEPAKENQEGSEDLPF